MAGLGPKLSSPNLGPGLFSLAPHASSKDLKVTPYGEQMVCSQFHNWVGSPWKAEGHAGTFSIANLPLEITCPSASNAEGHPVSRPQGCVLTMYLLPTHPLHPAGLISVLDLSSQAIIYELATIVYMVSLFWGCLRHTLHAGLAFQMAWGGTEDGHAVTLSGMPALSPE